MKWIKMLKKSEKGAITLLVLTTMIFVLVILTASYFAISNKSTDQDKKISQIVEQYRASTEDMEQEYQKAINSLSVKDYVKVGDYVDYDPTIATKDGKKVDEAKLTYISPTGTIPTDDTGIITHGNGYTSQEEGGGQTFTAKANDGTDTGLKWRVLSVSDNKVELISEEVVQTDANTNFILQGGIGYLYAEQELNEVCKIYGYGYGADTTARARYTIGGPEDEEFQQVKTLEEPSGARSIIIDDLNKIANITEEDFTTLNPSYGSTSKPIEEVYYPTLYSNNTTNPGQSLSKKLGLEDTYYIWNKSIITDINIQNMLFNENYWIASRCIQNNNGSANFYARTVNSGKMQVNRFSYGNASILSQFENNNCAVRPVVTLKADVIDLSIKYDKDNIWRLK